MVTAASMKPDKIPTLHPGLIHYGKLPESEQSKDRILVKKVLGILEEDAELC